MITAASCFVAGVFVQKFFPVIGDLVVDKVTALYAWAKEKIQGQSNSREGEKADK